MKLSKREKNLLIGLGVVLLIFGYHRFVISPQSKSLAAEREDKARYENELIEIQTVIASEKEIDNRFAYINDEIDELSRKYFSKIDQSRFILLINELLEETDLFVQNISFSPQRTESIGDALAEAMSVTLPYEGKYPSLLLFLERIRKHNPKTIIQNMDIKIKEGELLSGTILLDFYSLPDLVEDTSTGYLFDSSETNPDPFYSFEDYFITGDYYDGIDLSGVKIGLDSPRVLIEGFDDKVLDFVPSHLSIKGEIAINKNSKQGNSSLGLYYSFPPIQDIKHVHVVLNSGEGVISGPPENIGLWVHSNGTTKQGINLRIKDKKGEKHDINLCDNIDWIGWRHLRVDVPQDSSLYPMEAERIIVDIESVDDGKGTLLFDALEAFYTMDIPVADDNNIGNYKLYDVQVGDTLSSISKAFYSDTLHQNVIKKYNGINSNSDLKPGKIIIIPNVRRGSDDIQQEIYSEQE